MGLNIPARFGGAVSKKEYVAECQACGDLGTILLGDAAREPRTLSQIIELEAPCVCRCGDLFRRLFDEYASPLPVKQVQVMADTPLPTIKPLKVVSMRKPEELSKLDFGRFRQ